MFVWFVFFSHLSLLTPVFVIPKIHRELGCFCWACSVLRLTQTPGSLLSQWAAQAAAVGRVELRGRSCCGSVVPSECAAGAVTQPHSHTLCIAEVSSGWSTASGLTLTKLCQHLCSSLTICNLIFIYPLILYLVVKSLIDEAWSWNIRPLCVENCTKTPQNKTVHMQNYHWIVALHRKACRCFGC